MTRFSREWKADNSEPKSSASRVIRRADLLSVLYLQKLSTLDFQAQNCQCIPTLKANFSSASVNPGRYWYLVPAFATKASVVVGPARSRLAYLTPEWSPVSYWKEPEAGAARHRRFNGCWAHRRAALRARAERESMAAEAIERPKERNWTSQCLSSDANAAAMGHRGGMRLWWKSSAGPMELSALL